MTQKIVKIAVITTLILLIPLISMQFSEEVNWNLGDFIVAGAILFSFGLLYQFARTNLVSWIFYILFTAIGILNLILVHPIPGLIYLAFSTIYIPATNCFLKKRLGFTISLKVKIILALLVLWPTLAVGDLAEIFGL